VDRYEPAAPGPREQAQRVAHIVGVVARHGWHRYVRQVGLARLLPRALADTGPALTDAERFRSILEELGPSFVKFGQLLSVREDLFGDAVINELRKLQEAVSPFPAAQARASVEAELGAPVETLFAAFEDEPLAAASIAQVHAATLPDGTRVVVKVQRPGIEEVIQSDVHILYTCARLVAGHLPELAHYDPVGLVEEFADTIVKELDFRLEAHNAERFGENFAGEPAVRVPRIYWELSAKRVLTMGRVTPRPHVQGAAAPAQKQLADTIARLFLVQLFEHGFFHGDPHPGNMFVDAEDRVCFIDFGIVGRLAPRDQEYLRQMVLAIITRDADALAELYLTMGVAPRDVDQSAFTRELGKALEAYYAVSAQAYSFGEILRQFVRLGQHHHIRLPREWLLVLKAFMVTEARAGALDPGFSMLGAIESYVPHMLRAGLVPDLGVTRSLVRAYRLHGVLRNLAEMPETLARTLKRVDRGETILRIRHERLEEVEQHFDRASNRLSFSLVIGAVVIASSIVMAYGTGPQYEGIPLLGLVGYGVAAVLGLAWAVAILRSGRL